MDPLALAIGLTLVALVLVIGARRQPFAATKRRIVDLSPPLDDPFSTDAIRRATVEAPTPSTLVKCGLCARYWTIVDGKPELCSCGAWLDEPTLPDGGKAA